MPTSLEEAKFQSEIFWNNMKGYKKGGGLDAESISNNAAEGTIADSNGYSGTIDADKDKGIHLINACIKQDRRKFDEERDALIGRKGPELVLEFFKRFNERVKERKFQQANTAKEGHESNNDLAFLSTSLGNKRPLPSAPSFPENHYYNDPPSYSFCDPYMGGGAPSQLSQSATTNEARRHSNANRQLSQSPNTGASLSLCWGFLKITNLFNRGR